MPKATCDNPLANMWAIITLEENDTLTNNSSCVTMLGTGWHGVQRSRLSAGSAAY